jgi:membrane-associated phospholipid phosphatase
MDTSPDPEPMPPRCLPAVVLICCLLWLGPGCCTLPDQPRWGKDVKLWPGGERLKIAAKNALLDPGTWVPAAGALVCQIDSWDRNLTRWAASNKPVFGTQQAADNASYYLVDALLGTYVITGLAAPSGDKPGEWAWNKIKAFGVGAAAVGLTGLATEGLKSAVGRERPDGSNNRSFPSSTSSSAAVYGSLAAQNLNYLDLPKWADISLRGGIATLIAGSSWARLEGKYHYPSDVLMGAALGNFIGRFLNDAFIGPYDSNMFLKVETSTRGALVSLHWAY